MVPMLRQGYTRYITCILFILLIVNMSASFTLNNSGNSYTLSSETKLQRILETLVYSPVVVEAYRYRRIIPYDSDRLVHPYLSPGEVTGNPCGPGPLIVDSKHYELYCWLERVFMPATNSLDIPNNTVASASVGGVLSLKEIDIDIMNNTAILIPSLGNDFLVMNSTQPLSVNITSGGIYIRTLVIGDRYITTIWAVNTTDTIIALSTRIPQNTLTPTLPEIEQLGESSAPHESPLDKIVSNPVIMASIAVVIVVVVASIVKFILLKKAT